MDKLRMKFSKTGRAVYMSHLDLMRTMQRVFSRAGVPLKYSEGFNPHAKISILLPLSVGTASICEYMDFSLTEERDTSSLPKTLNRFMPEGVQALEVGPADNSPSALRWLRLEGVMRQGRDAAFYESFFQRKSLVVTRRGKRGPRQEDIAPFIGRAEFRDEDGSVRAELLLHAQDPSVSPELLMAALGDQGPDYYRFTRLEAFQEDGTPFS